MGVAEIIQVVERSTNFSNFAPPIEGKHGVPHSWIGRNMGSMYSPDDPVFWCHHCNVDRLWAFWQDCYDYESYSNTPEGQLPSKLYSSWGFERCPASDKYGLTDQIPFWYIYENRYVYAFPKDLWPTPQQAYFLGEENAPGWDGMQVRYGPDYLAEFVDENKENKWCSNNQNGWHYINQPLPSSTSKQALTPSETVVFSETLDFLQDQLAASKAQGLTGQEAIDFIATAECESSPPRQITPMLESWIRMNNEPISAFDRICDKSSARFCASFPNNDLCIEQKYDRTFFEEQELAQEDRTLEVIAIVGSVAIVILIIVSVISFVRQQGVMVHVKNGGYEKLENSVH